MPSRPASPRSRTRPPGDRVIRHLPTGTVVRRPPCGTCGCRPGPRDATRRSPGSVRRPVRTESGRWVGCRSRRCSRVGALAVCAPRRDVEHVGAGDLRRNGSVRTLGLPSARADRPHPRRGEKAPWVSVPGCRTPMGPLLMSPLRNMSGTARVKPSGTRSVHHRRTGWSSSMPVSRAHRGHPTRPSRPRDVGGRSLVQPAADGRSPLPRSAIRRQSDVEHRTGRPPQGGRGQPGAEVHRHRPGRHRWGRQSGRQHPHVDHRVVGLDADGRGDRNAVPDRVGHRLDDPGLGGDQHLGSQAGLHPDTDTGRSGARASTSSRGATTRRPARARSPRPHVERTGSIIPTVISRGALLVVADVADVEGGGRHRIELVAEPGGGGGDVAEVGTIGHRNRRHADQPGQERAPRSPIRCRGRSGHAQLRPPTQRHRRGR